MGESVNGSRLAKIIGFSRQSIVKWTAEGMPVKATGGRGKETLFDTAEVISWLVGRGASAKDPGLVPIRRRLLEIEANRRAIRLSAERGESAPLAVTGALWGRAIGAFKSRMLSIPRKAVPRLRGVPGDAGREKLLMGMVCEALDELATGDYSALVAGAVEDAGFQVEEGAASKPTSPAKKRGNGTEEEDDGETDKR